MLSIDSQNIPRAIIVANTHLTRDAGWTKQDGTYIEGPRPSFWVFDDWIN